MAHRLIFGRTSQLMPGLVFIVEEPSKETFLAALLPRFDIPDTLNVHYQSGTGYSEFGGLVRRVLRGWRTPGVQFVILCDQDQSDCVAKKQELFAAVPEHIRRRVAVRIVCDELESWYVGEPAALEQALPELGSVSAIPELRGPPDAIARPSRRIAQRIGRTKLKKVALAENVGARMNPDANTSHSFNLFIRTLRQILADAAA